MENIQKKLDDYLEKKRGEFPRFYFLSSDELIDILANAQNIDVIQGHLKTMFDNIVKLEIEEEAEIHGMWSNEKEYVKFNKTKQVKKSIETWLADVQEVMVSTLKQLLGNANKAYPQMERKEFVLKNKGQIVATVAQIQWCFNTEQAL